MLNKHSIHLHNKQQLKSSDPTRSVWVSASAGTGKTKVLTDRVLKLLLSGVSPHKILCLTFTKAAATEMLSRINNELKSWSGAADEFLCARLNMLLGRNSTNEEISLAKSLFDIFLKSSNFVQIQTIHGFCQGLLRLFPLEAGLVPGFEVIDEMKSSDLIEKVAHRVFSNITALDMEEAACFMETNIHDMSLSSLQNEIIDSKVKFKGLVDHFQTAENYACYLAEQMSIDKTKEGYFDDFLNFIDRNGSLSAEYDSEIIHSYNAYFLSGRNARMSSFDGLKSLFLTKLGEMRKTLIPREIVKQNPELENTLRNLQFAIFELDQNLKSISLIAASKHLFVLGKTLITEYENEKKYLGYLDYDDLIYSSLRLLSDSEFREWVLYKLDGGIEHILIDEAQDTSPEQWKIIASLMQEFYSGEDERGRTIFVVGDEKQSIYSFQGADINTFKEMKDFLYNKMKQSLKPYENIDLASSYRSTFSIIDFVHKTFENVTKLYGDIFPNGVSLECFRANAPGRVELWPVISSSDEEEIFWPLFDNSVSVETSSQLMSKSIAKYIKHQMDSGIVLSSTKKPISAGDIMILVRRRSAFVSDLISALHEQKLDVSGVDRLLLSDSVTSKDLISLGKFVLQPFDDLNLASLLKSPFFALNDDELKDIVLKDKKMPLWEKCMPDIKSKLSQFIEIYKAYSASDFYHTILNILGYKKQIITAGSEETEDVINEFLALVTNFVQDISSSLQEFVLWFASKDAEVKRNVENSGKIRIMTIHGSKGLQAPVVFVADTTSVGVNSNRIIWNQNGVALWNGLGNSANGYFLDCKNYNKTLEYQEYLRLLYVAMTRAEDVLVITGHISPAKSIQDGSWYDIVYKSMLSNEYREEKYDFLDSEAMIYENLGEISETIHVGIEKSNLPMISIPEFLPKVNKFIIDDAKDEIDSPIALTFGNVFHKIMEDVISKRMPSLADNHPVLSLLPNRQRQFISSKISDVFGIEEFKQMLTMELRTEVSFGTIIDGIRRTGRIDLLAIDDEKLFIVDYKTGYKDKNDFLDSYSRQLLFYKEAMQKIYPDHKVIAKILWLGDAVFEELL